jgi:transcription termination/antitermination protein NusG
VTIEINPADVLRGQPSTAVERLRPRWYAAHTRANHEKCVGEQLALRGIDHFLPVYRVQRKWADRWKWLEIPLFPGYVFVRLPLQERLRVLEIPSVARLVGFNNLPAALPDDEMQTLRSGLAGQLRAEPHPYLKEGTQVRIIRGPLAGCAGVLLRTKGEFRFVLSVDLIMRSVAVEVGAEDVVPTSGPRISAAGIPACSTDPSSLGHYAN